MVRTESVSHEKSFRACFPHVLLGPEPLDVATQRLRSRPAKRHNTDRMVVKIVPDDASIAELKKQAAECEQKATKEREPVATRLREKAALCREWIAVLKTGKWMS